MINATLGGNSVGSMKSLHDFTKCRGVSKKKNIHFKRSNHNRTCTYLLNDIMEKCRIENY